MYAVGDIVPGLQLAHRGFQQGIFVAEDIAGLDPTPIDETGIPRVTYCHPEVASVGLDEATARASVRRDAVETVTYDLGGNGKSQILKTQGFVKLVRRTDGPVVGVHLVGDRVGELVGEAQLIYNWEAHAEDVAPARARPPDPERGPRRGAPGARRQAAARPRLRHPPAVRAPDRDRDNRKMTLTWPPKSTSPQLGESVTEGTVTRWLKQVGDEVAVDEALLEVSTDKVDTEIPSPVAGTLLEIRAARGRDRRGRRRAGRDRCVRRGVR